MSKNGAVSANGRAHVDSRAHGRSRPRKVVTLIISGRDPAAFIGLTEEDDRLVDQLAVVSGPTDIWRLVEGARAAGYAILIRADLPPID